jgi:starch phosphorylase
MRPLRTFTVLPSLPDELAPLLRIAYDVHWAWNHDAIDLFRRLDGDLWESAGHNPVRLLGSISQDRLDEAAANPAYLAHMERVVDVFDEYDAAPTTWFSRTHGDREDLVVAYFSAEFGITECLSIFAGGLGILAGDHLKSASDLGVPLVGVGLLYQQGYFRQRLSERGWQQEFYEENDFSTLPLQRVRSPEGEPVRVEVPFPDRSVRADVWRADVGRVGLYLLDTNIAANAPADRDITDQLYGGDRDMRIRQELVLGVGGFRALEKLGIRPTVYHMNEGHSAFLVLEWIRRMMETEGLSFAEAREAAAGLVFTTHTPVPAGHDRFEPQLAEAYLGSYGEAFGLEAREFLGLGRVNPEQPDEAFGPTQLALRTAAHVNGVSELHGKVTRDMFAPVWPGLPVEEVPVTSITNGVHFESWISLEMKQLYDRYLGPAWHEEPAAEDVWALVERIGPGELWRTHQRRRERLVAFAKGRLRRQLAERGAPQAEIDVADVVLEPGALTIGFARRFATYKRGTLLLSDPDRLARLLNDPERPAQIIYAGKAHPADDAGKQLIQDIIELTRRPDLRRRLVFLVDYDMSVARYLLQGADVWLNTPIRPLEASGTSGMKAAANGVLNMSTLDGWWDEAHEPGVGWAIGTRRPFDDPTERDRSEAQALYDLLERDVVPLFYDRDVDGLPRRWIAMMKQSIAKLNHRFTTHRMVREYTERFYLPAAERRAVMGARGGEHAKDFAAWRAKVTAAWPRVRVVSVDAGERDSLRVGEAMTVEAVVHLAGLEPQDVTVQVYTGAVDAGGELIAGTSTDMQPGAATGADHRFSTTGVRYPESGTHGLNVRVLPAHPDLGAPLPGLITWAQRQPA